MNNIIKNFSILNTVWQKYESGRDALIIKQKNGVSELIARILAFNKINFDQVEYFLSPKLRYFLPNPMHFLDMEKAVKRCIEAIREKQNICIFGDYDVDGATSSALIKNYFNEISIEALIYIPDRLKEGYGLNQAAIKKLKAQNIHLIITVDCGTLSFDEIALAKQLDIDVIVIDHHLSAEDLPSAVAIVNPNRFDETTQYRYLAAVGVAYLFIIALNMQLKAAAYFVNGSEPNLLNYLDLVAIGTVCDVMPLVGLNRAFVCQGLKIMAKRQNIGLAALCDIANLNEVPNTYHLGFLIGPRINAGGRIGQSHLGSSLLSCKDTNIAHEYAFQLDNFNAERKKIELIALEEALMMAHRFKDDAIIIVASDNWHPGVIGIIASKLKDFYNKPAIVIATCDNIGKASCRSIKNIDLGSKIVKAKANDIILSGGGHAMAAGFTINTDKIQALREYLCTEIEHNLISNDKNEISYYIDHLHLQSINYGLVLELEKLQPFCSVNIEPKFRINDIYVIQAKIINNTHVSCLLVQEKNTYSAKAIRAIAFNSLKSDLGKFLTEPKSQKISIIGTIKANRYNGAENVNVNIIDVIL